MQPSLTEVPLQAREVITVAPGGVVSPEVEWTGNWYSVGAVTKEQDVPKISIFAVERDLKGASNILIEPLDVFGGVFALRWTGSSFGILYLSPGTGGLDVSFALAHCQS